MNEDSVLCYDPSWKVVQAIRPKNWDNGYCLFVDL